jgi:cobalt-zinc-cadmium efflux system membrane fusion protein
VLVSPGGQVTSGGGLIAIRSPEGATVIAEVRAAQAEAKAARSAFAREDSLLKSGVVSRQDWEAAQTASARASANAIAAQARSLAIGSPNSAGEVIVRSPIAGVVTAVQVSPGGYVAQGAALADVANPQRLEVVFSAPAEVAAQLQHGSTLRIIGPDGSEASAVIVGIAPLAQDTTGAAVVRARPSGGRLTPGSAVSASVRSTGGSALSVPSEAVQTVEGRTVVFVADANGFKPRPVTAGRSGAGYTEIVAGLTGAERIAGRGAFLLKAELSKGEAEHEH